MVIPKQKQLEPSVLRAFYMAFKVMERHSIHLIDHHSSTYYMVKE